MPDSASKSPSPEGVVRSPDGLKGMTMTARVRRLRPRDIALFVVVTAVVAVVVVMVGRERGIGEEATAVSDDSSEQAAAAKADSDLTLTLSAPEICETERGWGFAGEAWVYDDEGEIIGTRSITKGWANVAEIPVRWEVSGGTGPYTLVIDNEKRDGVGAYEGAAGTASVSCAPNPGAVSYEDYDQHRWYHANPEIDSGPKTIRATVTDSTGATAVASHDIYVVLSVSGGGTQLQAGETYRILGFLFTIPEGVEARVGAIEEVDGGQSNVEIAFFLGGFRGIAHIGLDSGTEVGDRRIERLSSTPDAIRGQGREQGAHDDPETALNSLLTALIGSSGQPPSSGAQ